MKTLHLNVKKKWFDMILSGVKKEEYREVNDYWGNRIMDICHDTVTFSNGYAKNRPQFEIELLYKDVRYGKVEWGAKPNEVCIVLELGKILNVPLSTDKE